MNPKVLAFFSMFIGAIVGAAVVWFGFRDSAQYASQTIVAKTANDAGRGKQSLSSASVLQIRPNLVGTQAASASSALIARIVTPESALRLAYKNATDYKAVLAMADSLPNDPEALRIKAQIVEGCAKNSDSFGWSSAEENERWEAVMKLTTEKAKLRNVGRDRRKEFIESLPAQHRDNPARIAAYDRLNKPKVEAKSVAHPCETLATRVTTRAELAALWKAAELAGDPFAQARAFSCSFEADYAAISAEKDPERIVAMTDAGLEQSKMTPEKLERFRAMLVQSTRDSQGTLLNLLTKSFTNGRFAIVDDAELSAQPRISSKLTRIVNCELSGRCEQMNAQEIDQACAYGAQCSAGNITDYWRFYLLSPLQAQVLESQRIAILKMLDSRDFSALKFVPRVRNESGDEDFQADFISSLNCY